MRFKGINKLDGWQYPAAVVWKDHLYVAYSVNKEDVGVTRIALRDLQGDSDDHRVHVRIDREISIVPSRPGLTRAMLGMVRLFPFPKISPNFHATKILKSPG
jgi:hypothetical protein